MVQSKLNLSFWVIFNFVLFEIEKEHDVGSVGSNGGIRVRKKMIDLRVCPSARTTPDYCSFVIHRGVRGCEPLSLSTSKRIQLYQASC